MYAFFELMKGVFYIVMLGLSVIYIIWDNGAVVSHHKMIQRLIEYTIPGVLVLSGLVLAYIIAMMIATYHNRSLPTRFTLVKTTIIGLFVGLGSAVWYGRQIGIFSAG